MADIQNVHSDDEIIPLSIAILAEHADYLPAGSAERIATTVMTYIKREGWTPPKSHE